MLETQCRQPVRYNIDVREWQDLKTGVPEETCETCTSGLVTQCFSTLQRCHFPRSSSRLLCSSPSARHVWRNFPTAQRIPEKSGRFLGRRPIPSGFAWFSGQRPSVPMDSASRWSCSVVGSAPCRPDGRLSCVEVELRSVQKL